MKYYKKFIACLVVTMIGSIYAQDNIINELAKGGKFIVRDVDQNEAMVIEDGNVGFSGTLKLGVLPKGDISNSIVVWDPDDKLFKILDQELSTSFTDNFKDEGWHTVESDGLADDNITAISASVQGTASVLWNSFNTDYGYIKLGPANRYWAHIYTNRTKFIFNKDVWSWPGGFSSYYKNNLYLKTAGTPRLTILISNGNVGVGTTNPSAKLDVSGQVKITGGTPGLGKVLTSDATGLATWQTPAAGGGSTLWTESGSDLYRTDGNIGIGTTNPSAKLDVAGQVKITGGAPGLGKVLTSDASGLATWQTPAAGGGSTLWTESGSNIYRTSGNIGIGTTNPAAKLDVNGTVSAKRYVIDGLYDITNGVWDLSRGNLAQVTYNSSITPITINSDGSAGTYVLVVKKNTSCTDCNITFLGADVKYPGGVNPTLSSGSNTTDIFSFIEVGNNTFYCFYAKNLQ